jgi:CheY-like chemotaxis protein
LRVLIVEDEVLLSMLLEDMLEQLDHDVTGICADMPSALAAVEQDSFDTVLLDLNLQGERTETVASRLREKGIPFVVASGSTEGAERLGAAAIVSKPYLLDDIDRALGMCREAAS